MAPAAVLRPDAGVDEEITSIVLDSSVTHQWQRPSFATVRVPLDQVSGTWEAARLKVYPDGSSLDFHGKCVHVDDQADANVGYRVATFASASEIFEFRPVRDPDGDFSKPDIIADNVTGPQIVQAALANSIDAGDGSPADCEGPMGITLGTFQTGGVSLQGAPVDWPMNLSTLFALLVATGEVDIVETPIDDGENMSSISAYNGEYGNDLTGSVSFEFATGAHNAVACHREVDYRELMNKLWIYAGPRVKSRRDPAGDQHWLYNITGSDPAVYHPAIYAEIAASRDMHYERMLIRIFDAADDEGDAMRSLYRRWWMMESWLRQRGKTLVDLTPNPGITPEFRVGDMIHVAAGSSFGGGFSGTQRVMEYSYRWSASSPVQLGPPIGKGTANRPPVMTSADAEIPAE